MRLARLAWTYLWARPLAAALNLALLSLGVGSFVFLLLVSEQLERSVQRDLAGIDLVVGAKGSPLQLILSGVFHLDVPTGNIPLAAADLLRRQPLVAEVVPLALGDSLAGYRIVGTEETYLAMYGAAITQGRAWQQPLEAVLGDDVARAAGLDVGATFQGVHGLGQGGPAHGDTPYTVVGRLARCGCVLDRLVLTGVASVWAVHEHGHVEADKEPAGKDHDKDHDKDHAHKDHGDKDHADKEPAHADEARELTLLLVRYKSPLAAVSLPRWVNAQPGLQAAAPALESARLLRMVGVGTDVLRGFAWLLMAVAGLSVFIALYHAVRERESDLAMMRMLGAQPARVAALVAWESLWLALAGLVVGLALGHGLAHALGWMLARDRSLAVTGAWWSAAEWGVVAGTLVVALLAAALPAWRALRVDVTRLLQSG
jgi:putative ABC transport system permease protein